MVYSVDTHPWINFQFDLARLTPKTWVLIGEAHSKCEHLVGSALKPAIAKELLSVYLSKGIQATTAIEGNTLSASQVRARIEQGAKLPESLEYQGVEVDNVSRALTRIDSQMLRRGLPPLTLETVLGLHADVLQGLDSPPDREPGKFRQHRVGVGSYPAPPAHDVEPLMVELTNWLQSMTSVPEKGERVDRFASALLAAVLSHLYIAWIHPFGDGNGRTARLVEVYILARSGCVPIVSTNLLSDFYNKTRSKYYERLSAASQQQSPYGFIEYAVAGFVDELRDQVAVVKSHNLQVAWESYVQEVFSRQPATDAAARQRRLALALPATQWISKSEAIDLTPETIRAYAVAGPRMPARDLNLLVKLDLAHKDPAGRYRSAADRIQAFIPPVALDETQAELTLLDKVREGPQAMMDPLFEWHQ